MHVRLLISDTFPYELLISEDAGPAVATSFGWLTGAVGRIDEYRDDILVIDNRITPEECVALAERLPSLRRSLPLFLQIVDPGYRHAASPYYQLCHTLCDVVGVHYVTKYEPVEWTLDLVHASRQSQMITLPYAYLSEREVQRPLRRRSRRLATSGALEASIYPDRVALVRGRRRNPIVMALIDHLHHPGYTEFHQPRHRITGSRYIDWLSNHTFAWLDPSSASLELQEYREVGYAGCVPVVRPAASLHASTGNYFFPLDPQHRVRDLVRMRQIPLPDLEDRVRGYRQALRNLRNPQRLASEFLEHAAQFII